MTYRTVVLSSYSKLLEFDDPSSNRSLEERAADDLERCERLLRFPNTVILELSFAELDFATRWCWRTLGPAHGECYQSQSEYRVCEFTEPHSHFGKWTSYWHGKSEYNYGFNEWYFVNKSDQDAFIKQVPFFNWGENYPMVYPME